MATIAEKSRTKEIIDRLQSIISGASSVPLAPGKISVYKEEMQSLLDELATTIEIELKTYHEVNDRRGRIISEAKKEAEKIIYQAEHTASRMRVTKSTTGVAPLNYETLDEEERSALNNANEIYGASLIYTDEMLTEVSELISGAYRNIRSDYEIIMQVMEDKLATLDSNRAELMQGLQEMDLPERSQQMLEIGQLLSSELYMSRMKAKMDSDEYDDGSVQLSLDLAEQAEEKTRQAEEKAYLAEQALARMTAERDALRETVTQMKQEGMASAVRNVKTGNSTTANFVKMMDEKPQENQKETDEEYEVVYVTEDELEEGEEYEIEYVDEEEEASEKSASAEVVSENKEETKADAEAAVTAESSETKEEKKSEEKIEYEIEYVNEEDLEEGEEYEIEYVNEEEEDNEPIPIIPHFKKSQKVATVPSEKVAKMATAITTDKKYSGLISRAVKQKEKELEEAVTVEKEEPVMKEKTPTKEAEAEKKVGKDGKEYVQATLNFDKDYEFVEF